MITSSAKSRQTMRPKRAESEDANMAFVVRSAKHKKGTYEGKDYDNVTIFAENPDSTNEQVLFGPEVEVLKMKTEDFKAALGRNRGNGFTFADEMLDALIQPVYDKWGNVTDFTLFKPEATTNGAQDKK